MSLVICRRCRGVYDLAAVTVTARKADASVFTTPCCGVQADTRQWKGSPDFDYLTERQLAELRHHGHFFIGPYGDVILG